jgi:hypothetical protein
MHLTPALRNTAAAFILLLPASSAAAPSKDECISVHRDAQSARRAGQLIDARARLLTCAAEGCPPIVADACAALLEEVELATPTVVFDVKDEAGADVADVTVLIDGVSPASRLDGRALAVDPGPRTFSFEAPGGRSVTQRFVVREGEKARHLAIVLSRTGADTAPGTAAPPAPTRPAAEPERQQPTPRPPAPRRLAVWPWIAGGVAVAGAAAVLVYVLLRPDPQAGPEGGLGTVRVALGGGVSF